MSKESMKLAEALQYLTEQAKTDYEYEIVEVLKEALAKQEQGEPVAWMKEQWSPDCGPYVEIYRDDEMGWRDPTDWTPLYTTPQQRPTIEETLAKQNQGEPVVYARKDQLQKAAVSAMLCELSPEPRQDRVRIYTHPQPKQEQGEPVGTVDKDQYGLVGVVDASKVQVGDKLYTTPQQRTWVELTDEQINQAYADSYKGIPLHEGIAAKLKENNT